MRFLSHAEFELLQQAMYTDPSDQSIWIYHRWLVAQGKFLFLCRSLAIGPREANQGHLGAGRDGAGQQMCVVVLTQGVFKVLHTINSSSSSFTVVH